MTDSTLVTGAFGLVGTATVRRLHADGRHVVATDLDTPANRKKAESLRGVHGVDVRWADLTDERSIAALLTDVAPTAIVHLAAMIPPLCYRRPDLARRVNVGATEALVRAASARPAPPRFVQASSVAVYGPRNPHRHNTDLGPDTPVSPLDIYGVHKAQAEQIVRESSLNWVVLRLGGVLTARPRFDLDLDMLYFEGLLPTDGRLHTVEVRDVARAFAAATHAAVVGETLMIGGDPSHRLRQVDVGRETTAAMGLDGLLPNGRQGDPDSDTGWFATDWMDTRRSQEALGFQHVSWPELLAETRRIIGHRRRLFHLATPFARTYLRYRAPYRQARGSLAGPWQEIARRWGQFQVPDAR